MKLQEFRDKVILKKLKKIMFFVVVRVLVVPVQTKTYIMELQSNQKFGNHKTVGKDFFM